MDTTPTPPWCHIYAMLSDHVCHTHLTMMPCLYQFLDHSCHNGAMFISYFRTINAILTPLWCHVCTILLGDVNCHTHVCHMHAYIMPCLTYSLTMYATCMLLWCHVYTIFLDWVLPSYMSHLCIWHLIQILINMFLFQVPFHTTGIDVNNQCHVYAMLVWKHHLSSQ